MVKYLNFVIISLLIVILYLIYTRQASFMDVVQNAMNKAGCVTVPGDCPAGSTAFGGLLCQKKGPFGNMMVTGARPMKTTCSSPTATAPAPPKCVTVPGNCPPGTQQNGNVCQRKGPFGIMVPTGPRPMVTKCS